MSLVIVDYGSGNIASVANMVRRQGGHAKTSSQPEDVLAATKLILPGVGAFDHGVNQLQKLGLFDALRERATAGVPLLGICVGMQLLGVGSEEGDKQGLSLIDATFKRFSFEPDAPFRIPHVGWNHITVTKPNPILPDDDREQRFYFTHSYHAQCADPTDILATTDHGYRFPAAFGRGNVIGVQFHPEKSHRFGMALIKNFLAI
jgi:imidazole glycerol-phosphate synthase subunit HisH